MASLIAFSFADVAQVFELLAHKVSMNKWRNKIITYMQLFLSLDLFLSFALQPKKIKNKLSLVNFQIRTFVTMHWFIHAVFCEFSEHENDF